MAPSCPRGFWMPLTLKFLGSEDAIKKLDVFLYSTPHSVVWMFNVEFDKSHPNFAFFVRFDSKKQLFFVFIGNRWDFKAKRLGDCKLPKIWSANWNKYCKGMFKHKHTWVQLNYSICRNLRTNKRLKSTF